MGIKKVYNSRQGRWIRKLLGISRGEVLPTPHELRIVRVTSKSMLRDFAEYPVRLYKGSPYYCPPLIDGDMDTLTKGKNPTLEHCDYVCYLAYRGDRIVGRIAGMINHNCNERWHQNRARFGFFDFEDDEEVVDALMDAVRKWANDYACDELVGPLGFTDMDREGMLIEGFSQIATFIENYNYPYYTKHMDRMGFEKDVDWLGFRIIPPHTVPERYRKGADLVRRRYNLEAFIVHDRKRLVEEYADDIFDLFNRTYSNLYGASVLTKAETQQLIDTFLPLINTDLIGLVRQVSDGKLVGFGVAMPSITKALQRSQGKLWPFGFIPIMKALKSRKAEVMDLMLIAVDPEYQGKGLIALIFDLMIPVVQQYGVRFLESNLELEHNVHVQVQWNFFRKIHHKTHRCYVTPLTERGEELAKRRREKRAREEAQRDEDQPNRLLMPRTSVEEMKKYEGENR